MHNVLDPDFYLDIFPDLYPLFPSKKFKSAQIIV